MNYKRSHLNQKNLVIGFCTTPDFKVAKELSLELIEQKLAACVSIVPKIISIYRWQGKIENEEEYLLIIKSSPHLTKEITEKIKMQHPYEVPEVIFTEFSGGNLDYLDWIYHNTKEK